MLPTESKDLSVAAIDLDGTLLTSDLAVSERTVRALHDWRSAGRQTIVVTARPPRSIRWLHGTFIESGTAICSNGALTYDFASDEVTPRECLDDEVVRDAITALRAQLPQVAFALEFGHHIARDAAFPLTDSPDHEVTVGDVMELMMFPIAKLIVQDPTLPIETLHDICTATTVNVATVTRSSNEYIEISAAGIDKAHALSELCAGRGISPENVIAFGDMPNDLPMLRWAGHAVVMANGHSLVKAEGDEITASNDEDGVAVVLERLLAHETSKTHRRNCP